MTPKTCMPISISHYGNLPFTHLSDSFVVLLCIPTDSSEPARPLVCFSPKFSLIAPETATQHDRQSELPLHGPSDTLETFRSSPASQCTPLLHQLAFSTRHRDLLLLVTCTAQAKLVETQISLEFVTFGSWLYFCAILECHPL
ncbi:unnamed protein product [Protopolystoma xenopodis]|uniref:Uncharacterized protein n=1 Tax=Protopolystoma xenopodis TaxID=117903 RepID=A0A3S5BC98_9PLAT|nr:unnamed protein product [Protopolystoma xenopodis]